MASAAEQMAANVSWATLGKATELRQRIFFTLGLLIVYRLGTYIPVPGIDGNALRDFMDQAVAGLGGVLNMFTGGAISRMGIFALGIMPYISASIIVQLLTAMVPQLQQLKKEGEQGRMKINQYTRYGTVLLATFQAYGLAVSLESGGLATDPGWFFRAAVVITLVGGTDVPPLARRADHPAGCGQRRVADHFRGHHCRTAGRLGAVLRTGPVWGDLARRHHRHLAHASRDARLRGVHGAVLAQDPHPVPAPSGGDEGL